MSDILIVDDERDIRELVSDILEDESFRLGMPKEGYEVDDELAFQAFCS